jgi:4-aminobutyrate aminotransferase-like enzyme
VPSGTQVRISDSLLNDVMLLIFLFLCFNCYLLFISYLCYAVVLEAIEQDDLQKNALVVGRLLHSRLKELQVKYPAVGDVRGIGLFLGVEFIKPRGLNGGKNKFAFGATGGNEDIVPDSALCKFVVDYLRYQRIITSRDGPDGNVLKLKPPLVFSEAHVNQLMTSLDEALGVAEKSGKF